MVIAFPTSLQAYYISTARELARMVGIRKAPILHHSSESIMGAATIRCFSQENRFLMKNLGLVDDYSRIAFHNSGTMEWLCVRINFLFNLVFFLVLVILVTLPRSAIDPSKCSCCKSTLVWIKTEYLKLALYLMLSNDYETQLLS